MGENNNTKISNGIKIEKTWKKILAEYFMRDEFIELTDFVKKEYLSKEVYPPSKHMFRAFDLCPFDKVSVVILGQDPYHGEGQANGLCFSVNEGIKLPPSLKNILKEAGIESAGGDLENWAEQGVLMLNAVLTVIKNSPASHAGKGWEGFTDFVIKKISDEKEGVVFVLWGNYARAKSVLIDKNKHLILEAPHPSPFSAYGGFFGCDHFKKVNEYLKAHNKTPIDWSA
ncbi:uracil-DNA glycosylase [Patescibacteria group bacterium]